MDHDIDDMTCKCGGSTSSDHTCPYAEELRGDTTECNCCESCTRVCAADI